MKMSKKFLAGALIFSACSALSTVAQADNTITFNGICFRYHLYGDH